MRSSALKCAENAAKVANLIFLSPFLSLLLIHFFVGEAILLSTVVGLGLILAGLGGAEGERVARTSRALLQRHPSVIDLFDEQCRLLDPAHGQRVQGGRGHDGDRAS